MTALCRRNVAARKALRWAAAAIALTSLASRAIAAEQIAVMLDQARILNLPDRATTIIVGNPLIADVSIQSGGLAVVTGKGYGATNFIVMDKTGAVLLEKTVEVKGPLDPTVVVYRGATRQTYSCTPDCSPRVTLGDTGKDFFDHDTNLYVDYFKSTLDQSVSRNNQAMSAGSSSGR
jgi:hypothetical protein